MSKIELINASSADQNVDAVVNAANNRPWSECNIRRRRNNT